MKKETTFILSEYKIFYYVLNQQEEIAKAPVISKPFHLP